jgi:hypothetical protein
MRVFIDEQHQAHSPWRWERSIYDYRVHILGFAAKWAINNKRV